MVSTSGAADALVKRWNFIERARLERELWDAFGGVRTIELKVEACARTWLRPKQCAQPPRRRGLQARRCGRPRGSASAGIEPLMRDQAPR